MLERMRRWWLKRRLADAVLKELVAGTGVTEAQWPAGASTAQVLAWLDEQLAASRTPYGISGAKVVLFRASQPDKPWIEQFLPERGLWWSGTRDEIAAALEGMLRSEGDNHGCCRRWHGFECGEPEGAALSGVLMLLSMCDEVTCCGRGQHILSSNAASMKRFHFSWGEGRKDTFDLPTAELNPAAGDRDTSASAAAKEPRQAQDQQADPEGSERGANKPEHACLRPAPIQM